ncbi:hypothetical protein, partial [Mesonia sp. K7]|uniref:hypothetical protein n=1 Tax=Mesonia sp. K7 TaxID=2218606 RepID=UPI000DAA3194
MTKKLLFIFLCIFCCFLIKAQNITLYQQFNGQYDYTAIGATLNPAENNLTNDPNDPNFCTINTSASAALNIPATQTVEAAYLYWAGSGSINTGTADLNVTLNGNINLGPDRTFSHTINTGVTTLDFFSAFKDITSIVQTTGNGTYTISDFDLTNVISTYCGNATNFGGWSIIVIYEDLSLPYNQVNIYDGLQGVSTTSPNLLLNLNNINVINNLGAKVGFLAWEGDASLAVTETLEINGFTASNPPLNPANNNFNGTNSFTNSTTLYNMDLDYYDIQNFVNIGDTNMTIEVSTGQDTILMNNLITVINSQLPDPSITIDNVTLTCNSRNIIIDYTLHNVGTETLPAGVQIEINAGGQSIHTTTSTAPIPIGGSDTFQANITLQTNIPDNFILELITNLDANGVSIIDEITDTNNIDTQQISLPVALIENPAQDIAICDDVSNDGVELFNLTSNITAVLGSQQNATVTVHTSQLDADANANQVLNLTNYQNITNPQTIYLRVTSSVDATCYVTESFDLTILASPNPIVPNIYEICNDSTDQDSETVFDLNILRQTILNGNTNWDVTFYDNNTDASSGNTNNLPINYTNSQNPQTIFIRVEDTTTNCVNIFTTDLIVNELPVYNDIEDIYQCDSNNDGFVTFDLNEATAQIIGATSNYSIVYYSSQISAETEDQNNDLPYIYDNTTAFAEQIWYRIEDINTGCYIVDSLNLLVGGNPNFNIPPPLVYCDEDNDGIGVFILSDLNQSISTDPNIIITYHHTQANAENDAIPLTSPFANTVHYHQTIYVRVEDATSECYSTLEATLVVEDSPQPVRAQFLDPLEACDWNTNGSEVFDLTQMEPAILANDVPPAVATDFDVRYYEDAGYTQEITVPTAYISNGMNQTIYVVVEGLNGCTGETSFELIVHPLPPFVHPQPLELCDVNNPGDETEDFTLEDASFEISGGDNSLEVTYYATQADADAGTNPLTSPYT